MALTNLTKVQTVGIGSNIEVVGVVTTGQFKSGTSNLHSTGVELTNLNVSGIATIGGNLSVGGVLTYEDVTNIDSIGIITARAGINVSGGQLDVGSNIKIGNAGIITATRIVSTIGTFTGDTAISGSLQIADTIQHEGDVNTKIRFPAADTFSVETAGNQRLRITSGGEVNIGGNYTQTTYTAQITSGSVNKKIGFGAAAHNDLSNEGSGIFFSRQSDGADGLSGIFAHTNSSLGIAARTDITFHAGGSSTYGAAPQRMALDTSGRLYLGSNFTGGNGDVDDLVISGTGHKGITVCSTDGGNVRLTFADGLSGTAAVIGSIVYEHGSNSMDFYTNALRMMRVDRANSTERLQIGAVNNSSAGTRLVVGPGNNVAATALIDTADTDINALTLSNWDGSATTNKVNMHFDCSGIAGFDVGIPAATTAFKIANTSGGGGYINMASTGETMIYRSGVIQADINNSVSGHTFVSQSDNNQDGFQVYNQHGSTSTRYTFACYDNRSGSKGRSFGVRGDGVSVFYGDVFPSGDNVYDLGSDSYTWDKAYVRNAYPEQGTEYAITSGSYSNAQWHDTPFGRDSMGGLDLNGVYIVTAFADLYTAMGGNYQCNYTWIVGIRNQYTNQTLVNTCPLLSVTGHSTNNFGATSATVGDGIRLGTSRTPASSGGEEQIVWRPAASTGTINNTAGRQLRFRVQRIGRASLG